MIIAVRSKNFDEKSTSSQNVEESIRVAEAARNEAVVGANGAAAEAIKKIAKKRLDSSNMRYAITTSNGFSQSENTFELGGVLKSTFFYKNDSESRKTYIASAHGGKPDDNKSIKSAERDISTVLGEIKSLINAQFENNTEAIKILILLQQIPKAH